MIIDVFVVYGPIKPENQSRLKITGAFQTILEAEKFATTIPTVKIVKEKAVYYGGEYYLVACILDLGRLKAKAVEALADSAVAKLTPDEIKALKERFKKE
jgi:hypothetical protein